MNVIKYLAALLLGLAIPMAPVEAQTSAVEVTGAWSRATPGGVRTGVAYMEITSKGSTGDRLVAARSDAAARVELHDHIHEDGVMKMRSVEAIEIPAGSTVKLAPGGLHLMLMELKQPLKAGEELDLTLVFDKAGEVQVTASVEPIGATGPHDHHGDHHNHDHNHDHDHDHHHHHGDGHKH